MGLRRVEPVQQRAPGSGEVSKPPPAPGAWMSVYPSTAADASCTSPGCACAARMPRYPSDLSDAQWAGRLFGELVAPAMLPDLLAVAREWSPDLLICVPASSPDRSSLR